MSFSTPVPTLSASREPAFKRYNPSPARPMQAPQWSPDSPPRTPRPGRSPIQRPSFTNMVTCDTPPPTPTPLQGAYLGDNNHLSPLFSAPLFSEASDFRRFMQPSRSPTRSPDHRSSATPPSPPKPLSRPAYSPPRQLYPLKSSYLEDSPPPLPSQRQRTSPSHAPSLPLPYVSPPSTAHLSPFAEGQRRRDYTIRETKPPFKQQEQPAGLGFEIDMEGVAMPVKETTASTPLRPLSLTRRRLSIKRLSFGRNGSIRNAGAGKETTQTRTGIMRAEAYQIMADHTFKLARGKNWFSDDEKVANGVAIRLAKSNYVVSPADDSRLDPFLHSLHTLNPEVAFTFSSALISAITNSLDPDARQLAISPSEHIQIVDRMEDLRLARPAQMACFIRLEGKLVVWCDRVINFQSSVESLEERLVDWVWKQAVRKSIVYTPANRSRASVAAGSSEEHFDEKAANGPFAVGEKGVIDEERQAEPRPTNLYAPIYTGCAVALDVIICCLFAKVVLYETLLDDHWIRLALLAVLPFMFVILLFMCDNIVSVIGQLFLPIHHMSKNSLYYSGVAPVRLREDFPHVTVVLPVYKEGLDEVLAPTLESVQRAMRTFELQGGSCNIIVAEDGLQIVSPEEVKRRTDFYDRNHAGWVARHPEGRAGQFKKSSNLNVMHGLSLRVEELMSQRRPMDLNSTVNWSQQDEDRLYEVALQDATKETNGLVWAAGDIRIGDYILLIDSDTRIPEDCFLDAVSEMEASPEVGVLQHSSGTFLAGTGYFEVAIAFFTKMVNYSISWTVANGGCAPFMGHNAFLRWSALQEQAFEDKDGVRKIWSEDCVSEDFVCTLNLLAAGYIVRWATYSKNLFLEGVSLSADDELNRWQKYAFGCSEMVFNPIRYWFTRSPISPLFRRFMWSTAPLHYKFSALSYIFSYWAIAAGAPLTIALYAVQGIFWNDLDGAFIQPFSVFVGITIVFIGGGTVALIVSRYRSQDASLFQAAKEHLTVLPVLGFFFGGLSWHVFLALIAHPVGYKMNWSATVKDVQTSTVYKEIPRILKRHRVTFAIFIPFLAGVIVLSTPLIPFEWRISDFVIMFPAIWCSALHLLYPIVLNEWVMLLKF